MAIVNFRWASQTFYLSFYTFIYSRTISLITVFSQYLKNVKIPFPGYSRDKGMYMARLALFRMFPVSCNIIYLFGQIKVFTSVVRIVRDLSKPHLIKICIIFWLTDKFHDEIIPYTNSADEWRDTNNADCVIMKYAHYEVCLSLILTFSISLSFKYSRLGTFIQFLAVEISLFIC